MGGDREGRRYGSGIGGERVMEKDEGREDGGSIVVRLGKRGM